MGKSKRFLEDNANSTADQRKEKLLEYGFTEEDTSVIEAIGGDLLLAESDGQSLYSQTHTRLGHVKGTIKTGFKITCAEFQIVCQIWGLKSRRHSRS
jgi:hypothetical protein